jgi:type IV secretion system protein VirB9
MTRGWSLALLLLVAGPAAAQMAPTPGFEDPRLQTVSPGPGVPVRLVVFPDAPLTVVFRPGEQVERVLLSDSSAFGVAVVGHNDAVTISPSRSDARADISVVTNRQVYPFELETGSGLAAAYVVRIVDEDAPRPMQSDLTPGPDLAAMSGSYRLRGDAALRPSRIADDGAKTYIRWDEHQALPAVFGIGPTGNEEVVNGYMRGGLFTIDRVYGELVFRIDKAKAEARRLQGSASR